MANGGQAKDANTGRKSSMGSVTRWVVTTILVAWAFILGVLVGQGTLPAPQSLAGLGRMFSPGYWLGANQAPPDPEQIQQPVLGFYESTREAPAPGTVPVQPQPQPKPADKTPAATEVATATQATTTAQAAAQPAAQPTAAQTAPAATPTAQAAPAAPPPPPPPPPSQGRFTVQVGAFKDSTTGVALVARLRQAGLPAYVAKSDLDGMGIRYRVRVGPYQTLEEAQGAASRIRLSHKLAAFVTRNE